MPIFYKRFLLSRLCLAACILAALAFMSIVRFTMNGSQTIAAESKLTESKERLLFDFSNPTAAEEWRTVNDNVMGGTSEGKFRIGDGKLVFYGDLSLENRGGFTSVRSQKDNLKLGEDEGIRIRFKGDGRTYYLSLYVPTLQIAHSYRAAFKTKAGQWQEITVPFDQFQSTAFGQPIEGARPVNPARINSIGFLLADKTAGPFELEVDWIQAVRVTGLQKGL